MTKQVWDALADEIQAKLTDYLGLDAELYKEPYKKDEKPQLRFETYVQYVNPR